MSKVENGISPEIKVNRVQRLARTAYNTALKVGFKTEIRDQDLLSKADELLEAGVGLVIVANHFSRQEAAGILRIPISDDVMRGRKIVYPVARHQKTLLNPLSRLAKCSPKYVVTEQTVKNAEKKLLKKLAKNPSTRVDIPIQNEGAREFIEELSDTLKEGGLAYVFPQGTRREQLYDPIINPTLSHMFAQLKRRNISFGLLFIGVDLKGTTDYKKVRGINFRQPYMYRIGNTYTSEEFLDMAGGQLRALDVLALKELEGLVSPRYAGKPSQASSL